MLAHIRNGKIIRKYNSEKGWLILEDGQKASPVVEGYENGNDKVVSVESIVIDNSTSSSTRSIDVQEVFDDRVVITTTIEDVPLYPDADAAKTAMVDYIDAFTRTLTGNIPADEKLSWTQKEAAARAYQAASADASQTAMIEGEAGITGEAPGDLAVAIIAKADLYRAVVVQITGLRRMTEAAIDAATPDQYESILAAAMTQAEAAKAALGL